MAILNIYLSKKGAGLVGAVCPLIAFEADALGAVPTTRLLVAGRALSGAHDEYIRVWWQPASLHATKTRL